MAESLQALIDAAKNGDTIKLQPGATYDANAEVLMQEREGVTIDGTGAYFTRTTAPPSGWQNQRQLQLIGCQNITILRLAVKGPKPDSIGYVPAQESQHGIGIDSSMNVLVDHCTVQRTCGDGIYVSGGCQHVTLSWNSVHQSGRHNVTFTSVDGFVVVANDLELAHRHTIDLEPGRSDEYVKNGTIAYNTLKDTNILPFINGYENADPNASGNVLLDTIHVGGNREIEDAA